MVAVRRTATLWVVQGEAEDEERTAVPRRAQEAAAAERS